MHIDLRNMFAIGSRWNVCDWINIILFLDKLYNTNL